MVGKLSFDTFSSVPIELSYRQLVSILAVTVDETDWDVRTARRVIERRLETLAAEQTVAA